jgi:hypothetical protein
MTRAALLPEIQKQVASAKLTRRHLRQVEYEILSRLQWRPNASPWQRDTASFRSPYRSLQNTIQNLAFAPGAILCWKCGKNQPENLLGKGNDLKPFQTERFALMGEWSIALAGIGSLALKTPQKRLLMRFPAPLSAHGQAGR